jgi:hypothetical protein
MRPESVLLLPPSFDDHLGLHNRVKNLPVDHLIFEFSVDELDILYSGTCQKVSRSNEWLYVDPEYPEVYQP